MFPTKAPTLDPTALNPGKQPLFPSRSKFSPAGAAVTVSIDAFRDAGRIIVRDHGIGIPEAFKPRIYEKFAQADATDTRQRGGTGLGLSIVQKIVIRHGGNIHFESAPGGGTIFTVEIPLWSEAMARDPLPGPDNSLVAPQPKAAVASV